MKTNLNLAAITLIQTLNLIYIEFDRKKGRKNRGIKHYAQQDILNHTISIKSPKTNVVYQINLSAMDRSLSLYYIFFKYCYTLDCYS